MAPPPPKKKLWRSPFSAFKNFLWFLSYFVIFWPMWNARFHFTKIRSFDTTQKILTFYKMSKVGPIPTKLWALRDFKDYSYSKGTLDPSKALVDAIAPRARILIPHTLSNYRECNKGFYLRHWSPYHSVQWRCIQVFLYCVHLLRLLRILK